MEKILLQNEDAFYCNATTVMPPAQKKSVGNFFKIRNSDDHRRSLPLILLGVFMWTVISNSEDGMGWEEFLQGPLRNSDRVSRHIYTSQSWLSLDAFMSRLGSVS